jgi:hypothetical protein
MPTEYTYSIDECDVENKIRLNAFREKRRQWKSWLDDDPDHAIWSTIQELVWRDVQFATIGQLAKDNPEGPLNTSLIAESLIGGHVAQQVLAIRRLMDRGRNRVSLARLIMDLKSNRDLLTRENIVCYDGLPYDHEAVEAKEWEEMPSGIRWGHTTGPRAWSISKMAQKQFDRVSGIQHPARSRDDTIPKSTFTRLEELLMASGGARIAEWSHAYLAHAGTPFDREAVKSVTIANESVAAAIRELARITEYVSSEVLWMGGYRGSLMPTPQFDVFEKLENPVADNAGQQGGAEVWQRKCNEWDEALDEIDELLTHS